MSDVARVAPGIADATDTRGQRFKKGTSRTVTVAGTMVADSGDLNAEIDNLKEVSDETQVEIDTIGMILDRFDLAVFNEERVRQRVLDYVQHWSKCIGNRDAAE